jgi:hypothetical protein
LPEAHFLILKWIGEPGGKKEFEYSWQKGEKLMGLFKKKIVKEIQDGAWGHLFNVHKITVETLHNELRCVERKGVLDDGRSVTFLRIFNLKEVQRLGIDIKGWESFDQKPDLILFEGYMTRLNEAHLEKKGAVYEKGNGCRTADSLTISFLFKLFNRGFTR